jgi:hypothetical protein
MFFVRVWNPTEETVSTCIQGAWFSFKPGQFKSMDNSKGDFIRMNRKGTGLVVLPEQFEPTSEIFVEGIVEKPEGKVILAEKREEGIRNLIEHHMDIIRNNQVSLRQDLAHRYPTADASKLASLEASKGEIESMKLVAKYKGKASDNAQKKMEEIGDLMDKIGPVVV